MKNYLPVSLPMWTALGLLAGACTRPAPAGFQGYLEGEFIYVAAPLAGRVEKLAVQKGAQVPAGAALFVLERSAELATQAEAADKLRAAEARLADLQKGSRPSELATLEARLEQARSAAELSQRELARQEALFKTGALAAADFDRARLTHERNTGAIQELNSQLATARLGARSDAIAAAASEVAAATAAKQRADWAVEQKAQSAPRAALVYDTLFREGEYATAGAPVVSLLPPENLKIRFFVPESAFAAIKSGDRIQVAISGRAPLEARISYLSPKPEYTPPILYNRDNRAKLVFMVEALFTGNAAVELHPGQPVDVTLVH
jgi:HlyD family secretion protein